MIKITGSGQHHFFDPSLNQDAIQIQEDENMAVLVVADGVSTCKYSQMGAGLAARAFMDLHIERGSEFLSANSFTTIDTILKRVNKTLKEKCSFSCPYESLASTLAGVYLDKNRKQLLAFSLGDCLILAQDKSQRVRILIQPADTREGTPVTTTRRACEYAKLLIQDVGCFQKILICSDGAWREMYDRSGLKPQVRNWILQGDFDCLEQYLENSFDDYSVVSLDL